MKESLFSKLNNLPFDNEIALSEGDISLTFSSLKESVKKCADNMHGIGVKSGDVVTISLPNTIEAIIAFYAINAVGGIANIVHPSLPTHTLLKIQEETHSVLLFGLPNHKSPNKKIVCKSTKKTANSWENFITHDSEPIEYNLLDSACVYLHSGGTTDKPKTIVLSSDNFNELAVGLSTLFEKGETIGYKSLTTLPLFHAFGLGAGVHAMLNLGIELVLVPKFNKDETPDLVIDKKINMILGVPLIFQAIIASKKVQAHPDLSFIKNCFVGGDRTPIEIINAFNDLLKSKNSNALLCEGYGLTESVSVCTVNRNNAYKSGSIGLPLDNLTLGILADDGNFLESESIGEICLSGGTVMQRYLSNKTNCFIEKDGKRWLKTGDYGYRDEDGYYYFVERKKRIVKISGVTVFPSEVEIILRTHHAVCEAFVKPSSSTNQKLKAFVSLCPNCDTTENELKEYCKAHLMKWAVPEKIVFLDALPLTPIGKIDKKHEIFNQ